MSAAAGGESAGEQERMSGSLIVPKDVLARLHDQSCANCRFSLKDERDLNCRRNPPVPFAAFERTPMGMAWIVRSMTVVVTPDQWCGEWAERGHRSD